MSDRNPHQFSKNNTSAKYVSCHGDTENQDSSSLIQISNKTTVYIVLLGCFTSCTLCVKIATPVLFNIIRYYINNCPMRCNTKQSIYYSATSLYMFRVPTTHTLLRVHKTVTTASVLVIIFVQLPPSNVAKLGHVGRR